MNVDVVKLVVMKDPTVISTAVDDTAMLPLHAACLSAWANANILSYRIGEIVERYEDWES